MRRHRHLILLVVTLVLLGSACKSDRHPASKDAAHRLFCPDGTPPDDNYALVVQPALDQAKRDEKVVLLYFFTAITDGRERFAEYVLADPGVAGWLYDHCVFVEVDMDWEPDLVHRYRPNDSGVSVLLTAYGEAWHRIEEMYVADAYLVELKAAVTAR